MEEAEQILHDLDEETMEQADQLFRRHRKTVLAMLSKGKKSAVPWLRAVACLIFIIGGVWLALTHQSPDPVPLSPVSTASVAPYYSPIPTFSPIPTHTPAPSPTQPPIPTNIPTSSPTISPIPTHTPSPVPTFTPLPTQTPFTSSVPDEWGGEYFPSIPSGYQLSALEQGGNMMRATYEAKEGLLIFEEYFQPTTVPIPESAQASYVLVNEYVALQMAVEDQIILCWEADGRTIILTAPANEAMELALSVKKLLNK